MKIVTDKNIVFEFKKSAIDFWSSQRYDIKNDGINPTGDIQFEFSENFYFENSKQKDFDSELKKFIEFYFKNEQKVIKTCKLVLENLLRFHGDIGPVGEKGNKQGFNYKTIELLDPFEHEFSVGFEFGYYSTYIVTFRFISESNFFVTNISHEKVNL
jgi:hypothetical protein